MTLFWNDNMRTLYNGDARNMADLENESVQCVVTSPPYWGLRKYAGIPDLIWGGDNHHEHEWGDQIETGDNRYRGENASTGGDHNPAIWGGGKMLSQLCSVCGAWNGQYGLEPTPELYVQHTVEILQEVRRVLRPDGVVFWNIGDSYAGTNMGHGDSEPSPKQASNKGTLEFMGKNSQPPKRINNYLKPKDVCLIPFRVAIAAQEDGWWVRSVIIWSKPNPMPESVKDRPTESHEYILMLTKSARYYWDQDAVREPHTWIENRPSGMVRQAEQYRERVKHNDPSIGGGGTGFQGHSGGMKADGTPLNNPNGRNIRSVWEFPTQPYPEAHFATFPEKLPELCIKAATPEVGCCSKCGSPWSRVINKGDANHDGKTEGGKHDNSKRLAMLRQASRQRGQEYRNDAKTVGWQPTCKCNADVVPSLVLDPFAGSGTTLKVAAELGRRAVGYELSLEYCDLAIKRNRQSVLGV